MKYWLIKSEPFKYSWEDFTKDGSTFWDGLRNYQARNNLIEMKKGDLCLYYHSNKGKEVVGLAEVIKEAYQDPTTEDDRWVAVDVKALEPFKKPVSLKEMKASPELENLSLIKQSRLSVCPVSKEEFDFIVGLGNKD